MNMLMKKIFFTLITLFTFSFGLFAQTNPVHWNYKAVDTGKNTYDLILSADVDGNWCVYSQFLKGDDGPIPTTFTFDQMKGVKFIGKVEEVGDKIEKYDELFAMKISKFKHHVEFVQKVKVDKNIKSIQGTIEFMTCNGKTCLPPTEVPFEIAL